MADKRDKLVRSFVAKASSGSPDAMDRNNAAKKRNRQKKQDDAALRQGRWSPRTEQDIREFPEDWRGPRDKRDPVYADGDRYDRRGRRVDKA